MIEHRELIAHSFYSCVKEVKKISSEKKIFFRTNPSLGYPNREIENIIEYQDRFEIIVNFFGVHGVSSELPSDILDFCLKNSDERNEWSLLFDFFNHRLLTLLYDIMLRSVYSRSFSPSLTDSNSQILCALFGFNPKEEKTKKFLPFLPLILGENRQKKQIQIVLQYVTRLSAEQLAIVENIPHSISIPENQCNQLGYRCLLGYEALLGKKLIDYQTKIAILIKNIDFREAVSFFPTHKNYVFLRNLLAFLTKREFNSDLYLHFRSHSDMRFILGGKKSKLGWGSVIGHINKEYFVALPLL